MASCLRATPGPLVPGHADVAGERGADGRADGGDLVFGLKGFDAEIFMARQFVQDVGGGRDRVGAVEERLAREFRRGDEADGGRLVARDLAVLAGRDDGLLDRVVGGEDLGRVGEVVAGLQGDLVGARDLRRLRELRLNPVERVLHRAVVEPVEDAEREEVLAAIHLLARELDARLLQSADVQGRDRQAVDAVAFQRLVFERVRRVVGLLQVLLVELVGVDDDRAAVFEVGEVHLQRRRVHGDEDVRLVAGRADVAARKVQLEAGDAGQGTGGRANLGGEVGQRRDVVADDGGGVGELRPRQLHAVAGVAGEADGHGLDFLCPSLDLGGWRRVNDGAHLSRSILRLRVVGMFGAGNHRRRTRVLNSRPLSGFEEILTQRRAPPPTRHANPSRDFRKPLPRF